MKLKNRLGTLFALFRYFSREGRWFLLPMLVVLLLFSALAVMSDVAVKVAPLWYAIF